MKQPRSRNMSEVRSVFFVIVHIRSCLIRPFRRDSILYFVECIVYTWDYHSSTSIWQGLRVQPILSDEVQIFKALITVHKILQEGHPVVSHTIIIYIYETCFICMLFKTLREAQSQTGWLETCARTVSNDTSKGESTTLVGLSLKLISDTQDMVLSFEHMSRSSFRNYAFTAKEKSLTVFLNIKNI